MLSGTRLTNYFTVVYDKLKILKGKRDLLGEVRKIVVLT
jgi:hypothetical protein